MLSTSLPCPCLLCLPILCTATYKLALPLWSSLPSRMGVVRRLLGPELAVVWSVDARARNALLLRVKFSMFCSFASATAISSCSSSSRATTPLNSSSVRPAFATCGPASRATFACRIPPSACAQPPVRQLSWTASANSLPTYLVHPCSNFLACFSAVGAWHHSVPKMFEVRGLVGGEAATLASEQQRR